MSPVETFFTFSFISTLAVAIIAIGCRYLPTLAALYKIFVYQWQQQIPSKYTLDNLKLFSANDGEG